MRNAAYLSRDALEALGFAQLGNDVRIHETCVLVGCDRISIGDNVRIDPFCVITAGEPVVIGSHCHISSHALVMGAAGIVFEDFSCISLGARVLSASDDLFAPVLIGSQFDDEFRRILSGQVRLRRHTSIGANSIVLPQAEVGEGATIGALSLVKGEIAPWTVNAGVPARKIGERDKENVLRTEAEFLKSRNRSTPDSDN
jgi:acetyltransferase-like isoleucine patch superfamily enzyme